MPGPHDKIIAEAAKGALRPLDFARKGRSRTWLTDHKWWLTAVEFQPSAWSKGSHLNVAAHWLWSEMGHLSFDFGNRVGEFVEYQSDEQFTPAAALVGRIDDATAMFSRILDEPSGDVLDKAARSVAPLVNDPRAFHAAIFKRIARQRAALRLPTMERSPF